MGFIEEFLSGEMEVEEFSRAFRENSILREQIDALVPQAAVNDPNHHFWDNQLFFSLSHHQYKLTKLIYDIVRFDDSFGDNYVLYDTIERAYKFSNKDFCFTSIYLDLFNLYLDAIGEYYEGSEVKKLIEQIVRDNIGITPKTKRLKETKKQMRMLFHTTDGKRPYWIQSPEWPMGKNSPMKYIGKKRKGEAVEFCFEDVDTGKQRIVTQYY